MILMNVYPSIIYYEYTFPEEIYFGLNGGPVANGTRAISEPAIYESAEVITALYEMEGRGGCAQSVCSP